MARFIIVVFVICACALSHVATSSAVHNVPNYLQWLDDYREAVKKLLELAPKGGYVSVEDDDHYADYPVDEPKLHYGLLVEVLSDITAKVGCSTSYEDYYLTAVRKGVTAAWGSPHGVGNSLRATLKNVDKHIKDLVDIIDDVCQSRVPGCAFGVHEKILKSIGLEKQRGILHALSEVSQVYLKNTYAKEAQKHGTVQLLVEGKEKLKELAEKLVAVKRSIHNLMGKEGCSK